MIGSQKYELQSLQRGDLQTTQDSMNSGDEVNLKSIQGVCVDESVDASTATVIRITESAISHPPQAGGDRELFLQREHTMPTAASKLAAVPSAPPASISKLQWPFAMQHLRRFLHQLKVQKLQ